MYHYLDPHVLPKNMWTNLGLLGFNKERATNSIPEHITPDELNDSCLNVPPFDVNAVRLTLDQLRSAVPTEVEPFYFHPVGAIEIQQLVDSYFYISSGS